MISSESLRYLLNSYDVYDVFGIYNFATRYYGIPIKSMTLWPLHEFPGFADDCVSCVREHCQTKKALLRIYLCALQKCRWHNQPDPKVLSSRSIHLAPFLL